MAHINLLPWREELRTQRNKDFGITCFVFALLVLVAVGSGHYWFTQQIDFQGQRNKYIENQIAELEVDTATGVIRILRRADGGVLRRSRDP